MVSTESERRGITTNQLLAALPEDERRRLEPLLEPVELHQGDSVYEAGAETRRVYFPTTALVSIVTVMESGGSVEATLVGNDGMVGSWLAAGVLQSPWNCIVQLTGEAYAFDAERFAEEFTGSVFLRGLVMRHSVAQHYLTAQSVGCNRFHDLSARGARWLLMTRDRVGSDELHLTHEFLAQMLGVYRPSVTVALGVLEQAGIIGRPRRGVVRILDPERLEDAACECYRRVREYMEIVVAAPSHE